ncbi:hypothetical protein BATDEDRAFT_20988 [Batrachochytrium dendrobatidis JAM81]|uniref:U2 small nuclear ribonucleoprotein A' n=2 Tax=Batrachochytrium dendrobatidis TaxID=109871 RepID=F4PD50_BATDJ|nr:uncharacterized protein BATDEDRAFT_20988 [Batrachochytrium dendrobatidis JAM81]EGF77031.1 hypothetical protein BATDEDRAFT_20988 [Batrachochytrium dendrobatidis JAM81]KAJ8330839.1 U2 snRNP complex subunit [Batrachochytrium dendrobatidis]KAK5672582.1 U2 snRNP complex subunit [Batrachochytrium dendrobatidis]OAJ45116.1 hypothetical protein BDEG_28277 [Batrachochytrium dendrobatidis JEL423]|eukprot:XP_006682378.1 hypothetical protein BATDEDRAFT_20988 [Batrachochytrium dendrobatidis JAM81]
MKLDYELLTTSPSRINPIGERELILRGHKLQRIENLTLTKDQNDTLDLTNNSLVRLDAIPHLPRLKTLLLSSNRITKIDKDLPKYIPNLRTLILSNNQLEGLSDLDALLGFEKLETLALLDNPVASMKLYRLFVVHRCPSVRVLDFRRVREQERLEAAALFSGEKGANLLLSLSAPLSVTTKESKVKTFEPGENLPASLSAPRSLGALSLEEADRLRTALSEATSLEEIAYLERLLKGKVALPAGYVAGSFNSTQHKA